MAAALASAGNTSAVGPDTKKAAHPSPIGKKAPTSDDEILGIGSPSETKNPVSRTGAEPLSENDNPEQQPESPNDQSLRAILDENPELRRAWQDARAYRETFPTPEAARTATAQLADLDRMDALFFSRRPEDHAVLARSIAEMDAAAFSSLAQAMGALAAETQRHEENRNQTANSVAPTSTGATRPAAEILRSTQADGEKPAARPTAAQQEFFQATNAAAVQSVIDAIESQVERLLPRGTSKNARNRVVGEIYRELDNSLRSNRQLAQQVRDALRSGALDDDHMRAIVGLISGRARQALPGVAKRVFDEWTSTVVTTNQERRTRQRAAERRVDIAGASGGGNEARRPIAPRDIDYSRMSDADILNL